MGHPGLYKACTTKPGPPLPLCHCRLPLLPRTFPSSNQPHRHYNKISRCHLSRVLRSRSCIGCSSNSNSGTSSNSTEPQVLDVSCQAYNLIGALASFQKAQINQKQQPLWFVFLRAGDVTLNSQAPGNPPNPGQLSLTHTEQVWRLDFASSEKKKRVFPHRDLNPGLQIPEQSPHH